jgi:hypothetical protein
MSISLDFNDRYPLWVKASLKLGSKDDPFPMMEMQGLGIAERVLLSLERAAVKEIQIHQIKNELGPDPLILSELYVHSQLWLFGMFELFRTSKLAKFEKLSDLYRRLVFARTALAKHQIAGKRDFHYPDPLVRPECGMAGWRVFDPKTKSHVTIFRTEFASEFLAVMSAD